VRRATLAVVLVAAGCGGSQATDTTPRQPHLPRTLAESWARQADAVAAALAANDGCAARTRAAALQRNFISAVKDHRVPQPFLEPLGSGVNDLAGRITCTPPPAPAPAPAPQPVKPKHEKTPKHHDHGKHKGNHRGEGED
jgi:hypothetical protein